jgi:hypothetical protein
VTRATAAPTWRARIQQAVAARLRGERGARFWGGVVSVAVAAFLFSRIGIDAHLYRDDAIYAYGGQQMTHGVAPYASIFDPKGPLSTFLAGSAAWIAHGIGVAELTMMRLAFFTICVLTALATYLLVLEIWGSVLGAISAAVVFASFKGFAQDALRGPDAHTAGPLWAVLSMWLALRRHWYWAAFAGSLATLVKQTYGFYALAAIGAALLFAPDARWRALLRAVAGALTPFVLTLLYFAAKGAVGKFWESAVVFPARGLHRARPQTVTGNARHIAHALWRQYNFSGILFGIGMALLVAVAVAAIARGRHNWRATLLSAPLLLLGLTLLAQWAYLLRDYLSYDDLYQLLPYAAAGFGAVVSLAARRLSLRAVAAATVPSLVALTVLSCIWFVRAPFNDHQLPRQRAAACALNRIVPAGTRLYAVGDPVPLVLTGRRNPDRYIYLFSGVAEWKLKHTHGGMRGWVAQVTAPANSVIVFQSWNGKRSGPLLRGIRHAGYRRGYVGRWRVYVDAQGSQGASAAGLRITPRPTPWPLTASGSRFTVQNCGGG